jgi:hypothetical protein
MKLKEKVKSLFKICPYFGNECGGDCKNPLYAALFALPLSGLIYERCPKFKELSRKDQHQTLSSPSYET